MGKGRVALFVGSGISLDSDAPDVDTITNEVLESPWYAHTDWKFYPVPKDEGLESYGLAKNAQILIRLINDQIKNHLLVREGRLPNYEDHFACLKQVIQDETGDIINPLISKDIEYLKASSASQYLETKPHIDQNRFVSLAERASDLIQCIVYHALQKVDKPVRLELLTDAVQAFDEVDIISLNHDLLIEYQFEREGFTQMDSQSLMVMPSFLIGLGRRMKFLSAYSSFMDRLIGSSCILKAEELGNMRNLGEAWTFQKIIRVIGCRLKKSYQAF